MREIQVTNVFERNFRSKARIAINPGGARSSKSHSLSQLHIQRFWNYPRRKILVSRKTGPALHLTAYKLVTDMLSDYGYLGSCRHDKTYHTVTARHNGSMFAFIPIDDPEKIKSTEWNDIWLEEATEFTWEDWLILQTRLSAPAPPECPNRITLSFNPVDEQGWINQRLIQNPAMAAKIEVIKSTYRDNPFLDDVYIAELQSLKDQDTGAFQVFAEGEYATLTNVIYAPYEQLSEFPKEFDEVIYGLDFGFNNPSALIRIGIKDERNHYLAERLYQTHLTNGQLIDRLKDLVPEDERSCPIYADAAEPDRIEEIYAAGFNILAADKEVSTGIDFCKRQKFFTLASNVDLNKERSSYKWRQDKNGNVLDEPVKYMDHLMDAKRYALWSHNKERINSGGVKVTAI